MEKITHHDIVKALHAGQGNLMMINTLDATLRKLIRVVADQTPLPMKAPVAAVLEEHSRLMEHMQKVVLSPMQIFSGNGPLGQKLNEMSAMNSFFYAETSPVLLELIQRFNHNPSDKPEDVAKLHAWVKTTAEHLDSGSFSTPGTSEHLNESPLTIPTGIYQSPNLGLVMVLNSEPQDQDDYRAAFTIGLNPGSSAGKSVQLLLYHPLEYIEVATLEMVLPRLIERLDHELQIALAKADREPMNMFWDLAFRRFKEDCEEIFDSEETLPTRLFDARGQLVYERYESSSNIYLRQGSYGIVAWNTKGEYACRNYTLGQMPSGDYITIVSTLSADQIPEKDRRALMSRAQEVTEFLKARLPSIDSVFTPVK